MKTPKAGSKKFHEVRMKGCGLSYNIFEDAHFCSHGYKWLCLACPNAVDRYTHRPIPLPTCSEATHTVHLISGGILVIKTPEYEIRVPAESYEIVNGITNVRAVLFAHSQAEVSLEVRVAPNPRKYFK